MKNIKVVDMQDNENVSAQELENVKGGAAFMKLGDIKGEATDAKHKEWIIIESMSSPIYR